MKEVHILLAFDDTENQLVNCLQVLYISNLPNEMSEEVVRVEFPALGGFTLGECASMPFVLQLLQCKQGYL